MEYVYSAMLLHKAGQKINEANIRKVLESAGVKADDARIKSLVAALEGVNIDEAIEKAAVPVAAPVMQAAGAQDTAKKPVDEAKKAEEEKKSEEQAAAGLGSLFG